MKVYKFRDCYLNTLERQVVKNGIALDLTPKAFDVLQLLVESGGEIVTKDELLGKVWSGSFVEEGNLAVHISRLREMLGHSKGERYIETVSGTGYRFVAFSQEIETTEWTSAVSSNGHISESGNVDSESYRHYLKGKYFLGKRTAETTRKAIKCFRESLSCDPTNILANAGVIESYLFLYCVDEMAHSEALTNIRPILDAVEALDQNVDQLQVVLADIAFHLNWNFSATELHLRRALETNPNCLIAHSRFAELLVALGRKSEALKELRNMMNLDPLSVITCKRIGRALYRMGRFEEAVRYLKDAVELEPVDYEAHALLGAAFIGLRNYDDALSELSNAIKYENDIDVVATIGFVKAMKGDETGANEIIGKVESLSGNKSKFAVKLARIFGALNQKEKALRYLNNAFEYHDSDMTNMMSDPRFEPIKTEPEFTNIAERVGLVCRP